MSQFLNTSNQNSTPYPGPPKKFLKKGEGLKRFAAYKPPLPLSSKKLIQRRQTFVKFKLDPNSDYNNKTPGRDGDGYNNLPYSDILAKDSINLSTEVPKIAPPKIMHTPIRPNRQALGALKSSDFNYQLEPINQLAPYLNDLNADEDLESFNRLADAILVGEQTNAPLKHGQPSDEAKCHYELDYARSRSLGSSGASSPALSDKTSSSSATFFSSQSCSSSSSPANSPPHCSSGAHNLDGFQVRSVVAGRQRKKNASASEKYRLLRLNWLIFNY